MEKNEYNAESALLMRIAAGDEEAFRVVFNMYSEKLFRYVLSFIKSSQVAEELVMDVFMKIWLGREMVSTIQNFNAFIFRVAHNKSIDFLRAAAGDPPFRDLLWETLQLSEPQRADNSVLSHEFECKVRQAVSLLPQQRKKVFELSREQEMSHEEIAKHLGLSKHTVNNHIVEAKRFIRTYLGKDFDVIYLFLLFASN